MPQDQGQEKTEQPTARRLQKAREKGQSPQSKELPSAFALMALLLVLALLAPNMLDWFVLKLKLGLSCDYQLLANPEAFLALARRLMVSVLVLLGPVFIALAAAGLAGTMAVTGLNFAPEALSIRFDMINPASGLKNLFSTKSLLTLLLGIGKLIIISVIVYFYVRSRLDALTALRWSWSVQILAEIAKMILGAAIRIALAVLVLAVIDAIYQKWKWKKDLRMSKQEVKEERRQDEGAPEVKSRLRILQLEMSRKRMLQEVPKASVVLVNPTHVAVALRYDKETMDAPLLVAKGADHLSEKIRDIARAYGVPIIRRPELARSIYSTVEVGRQIPQNLYLAVAEVLAMIYRLKQRRS